jgi:glyoxylase-like metal-dependent hydrolase (beta-lactamase superfamily II)
MNPLPLVSAALVTLAACAPPPADQESAAIELYAMDCGRIHFPDTGPFADDGSFDGVSREFVDPCYLIRHPSGDLLWDTGFPDTVASMPDGMELAGLGAHVTRAVTLVSQLAQLGLTPADIEFLSVSHSHGDHVGNAGLFASATFLVDADERAVLFSEEARAGEAFPNYAALENAATHLIEGDGNHDVFGDGTVTIIQAPGHTPGHTILRVDLADAGPVLLTGDMWHLAESRERRTVPRFNVDRDQTLASMDKVEALARETGARVIRQHVPEDFAGLPRFPEALR